MKSDLIDIDCALHAETDLAVRVSTDGDDRNAVWLPHSQIEVTSTGDVRTFRVTLPVWLANEKGLI